MKTKIWKKNAVLATVILFVCVAVYLNWRYGREAEVTALPSAPVTSDRERIAAAPAVLSAEEEPLAEDVGETDLLPQIEVQTAGDSYFSAARLSREQARDESVELLRETAGAEDASQAVKDDAYAALNRIAEDAILESQIEGLVMAKGFRDCVAYVSRDSVNVVVSSPEEGLDSTHVTQIKDIVIGETGVAAAAIRIVEVSG